MRAFLAIKFMPILNSLVAGLSYASFMFFVDDHVHPYFDLGLDSQEIIHDAQ